MVCLERPGHLGSNPYILWLGHGVVPLKYDLKKDDETEKFERYWVKQIERDYYRTQQNALSIHMQGNPVCAFSQYYLLVRPLCKARLLEVVFLEHALGNAVMIKSAGFGVRPGFEFLLCHLLAM